MVSRLTRRQNDILTFVQRHTESHGYPPSVREIGQAMGLTSSSTVHSHLAALERKGYLRRDPSKPRALEILRDHSGPARRIISLPSSVASRPGRRSWPSRTSKTTCRYPRTC